jgi:hypothetical protein
MTGPTCRTATASRCRWSKRYYRRNRVRPHRPPHPARAPGLGQRVASRSRKRPPRRTQRLPPARPRPQALGACPLRTRTKSPRARCRETTALSRMRACSRPTREASSRTGAEALAPTTRQPLRTRDRSADTHRQRAPALGRGAIQRLSPRRRVATMATLRSLGIGRVRPYPRESLQTRSSASGRHRARTFAH